MLAADAAFIFAVFKTVKSLLEVKLRLPDAASIVPATVKSCAAISSLAPTLWLATNVAFASGSIESFLSDFAELQGPKILIHGGGKMATKLSAELGIQSKLIDGRRITNAETLKVVTMVYAGLINKNIVATLQDHECNAIGLTGADANIIRARKRPIKKIFSKEKLIY